MKLIYSGFYGLALLYSSVSCAVQITGQAEPQRIPLGESITYTLTADEHLADDALDIRPLFKDFIIGNLQITHPSVNETVWIIPLQPVTAGELMIPALKIADAESQPFSISVQETNQSAPLSSAEPQTFSIPQENQPPAHLIESKISAESAYLNELITYTVKTAKRADPDNRPPVIPDVKGATIIPAGQPAEDQEIFADHYQETLTYQYFVIPNTVGSLKLPGAYLASDTKQKSDEEVIEIKSMPAAFHGSVAEWLPSAGISIEDRWEPQTSYAKTGQPLTRIIKLTGINNTLDQLPEIPLPQLPDIKIYSDGETSSQEYQNGMLISQKTFRQVFVPEKNVAFTAPEFQLHWWNTISDRAQTALLEERKFQISLAPKNETSIPEKSVSTPDKSLIQKIKPILPDIIAAVGLFFATLTPLAALAWYYRSTLRKYYQQHQLWKSLHAACDSGTPNAAYNALLAWASFRWNKPFTCIENLPFAIQLESELNALQAACFHHDDVRWNGLALLHALRHVRPEKKTKDSEKDFEGFIH